MIDVSILAGYSVVTLLSRELAHENFIVIVSAQPLFAHQVRSSHE